MNEQRLRTAAMAAKDIASKPELQELSPAVREAATQLLDGLDELIAMLDDEES